MSWNQNYSYSGQYQPPLPPTPPVQQPPPPPPSQPNHYQQHYSHRTAAGQTAYVAQQPQYATYSYNPASGYYGSHVPMPSGQSSGYASGQAPLAGGHPYSYSSGQVTASSGQSSGYSNSQVQLANKSGHNRGNVPSATNQSSTFKSRQVSSATGQSSGSNSSQASAARNQTSAPNSGKVPSSTHQSVPQQQSSYAVSEVGKALVKSLGSLLASQQANLENMVQKAKSSNTVLKQKFVKSSVPLTNTLGTGQVLEARSNKLTVQLGKSGMGYSGTQGTANRGKPRQQWVKKKKPPHGGAQPPPAPQQPSTGEKKKPRPPKEKEVYQLHHHGLGYEVDPSAPAPTPNTKIVILGGQGKGRGKNVRIMRESVLTNTSKTLSQFQSQGELATLTEEQLAAQPMDEQFDDANEEDMVMSDDDMPEEPHPNSVREVMQMTTSPGAYPQQGSRKRKHDGELPFGMNQLFEQERVLDDHRLANEELGKLGMCVKKLVDKEGKSMNRGEIFKKALNSFVMRSTPITMIVKQDNDVDNFLRYGKMMPYACLMYFGRVFVSKGGGETPEGAKQQSYEVACNRLNKMLLEEVLEEASVEDKQFPNKGSDTTEISRETIYPKVTRRIPSLLDSEPDGGGHGSSHGVPPMYGMTAPAGAMVPPMWGADMNRSGTRPYGMGHQPMMEPMSMSGTRASQGREEYEYGPVSGQQSVTPVVDVGKLEKLIQIVKRSRKKEGAQVHPSQIFKNALERFSHRDLPITIITKEDNDVANFLRYGRMLPYASMLFYSDVFLAKAGGETIEMAKEQVLEVTCNRLISILPSVLLEEAEAEDNQFPIEPTEGEVRREVIEPPVKATSNTVPVTLQSRQRQQPLSGATGQVQTKDTSQSRRHWVDPVQPGERWLKDSGGPRPAKERKHSVYKDSRYMNEDDYVPPKVLPSLFHLNPPVPKDAEEYVPPSKRQREFKKDDFKVHTIMTTEGETLAERLEKLRRAIKKSEKMEAREIITHAVKETKDVNTSAVVVTCEENDVECFMKEGVMNPYTSYFYVENRRIMKASGQTVPEAIDKVFQATMDHFKKYKAATILDWTNSDDSLPVEPLNSEVDRINIASPLSLTREKLSNLLNCLKENPPSDSMLSAAILNGLCRSDDIDIVVTVIICAEGPHNRRIHTSYLYLGDFFLAKGCDPKKQGSKNMAYQAAVKRLMTSSLEDILAEEGRMPRLPLPDEVQRWTAQTKKEKESGKPDSFSNKDSIKREDMKKFVARPWSEMVLSHNKYSRHSDISCVYLVNSCCSNNMLLEVIIEDTGDIYKCPVKHLDKVLEPATSGEKTTTNVSSAGGVKTTSNVSSSGGERAIANVRCQVFLEKKLLSEVVSTNDDIEALLNETIREKMDIKKKLRALVKTRACDIGMGILYKECWTLENKIQNPLELKLVMKDEITEANRNNKLAARSEMSSGVGGNLLQKMGWAGGALGTDSNQGLTAPIKTGPYSDFTQRGLGFTHDSMMLMTGEEGEDFRDLVEVYLDHYVKSGNMDELVFPPTEFNLEERLAIVQVARKLGLTTNSSMHKNTKYMSVYRPLAPKKMMEMLQEVGGSSNKYALHPPGTFEKCPTPAPHPSRSVDAQAPGFNPFGEKGLFASKDKGDYVPMDVTHPVEDSPVQYTKPSQAPKWQQWKQQQGVAGSNSQGSVKRAEGNSVQNMGNGNTERSLAGQGWMNYK